MLHFKFFTFRLSQRSTSIWTHVEIFLLHFAITSSALKLLLSTQRRREVICHSRPIRDLTPCTGGRTPLINWCQDGVFRRYNKGVMILHWIDVSVQIDSQVDLVDWLHLFLEMHLGCLEIKGCFWRCRLIDKILLRFLWFYRDFCFCIKFFDLLLAVSVAIYDIEDTHTDNYHYQYRKHDKD